MTTLLVASAGGHIKELHRLAPRVTPVDEQRVWVTNETVQTKSLLEGEDVIYMPAQYSRELLLMLRNAGGAVGVLRRVRPSVAVSTGAGIALSFLPWVVARGAGAHYVESGTRVHGPSVTGTLLQRVPGVRCYTQHASWASRSWRHRGSVFDGFAVRRSAHPVPVRRVVVMLGSWMQPFRGLVERLVEVLPPGLDTLWQTGHTDVSDLPIDARAWVPARELSAAIAEADAVVTHAGVGATLDVLEAGRLPVVVPRRKALGEQVDDHQVELGGALEGLDLAVVRTHEALCFDDIVQAAACRIDAVDAPPFVLDP